ncbi:MAG: hypothetical protein DI582_10155 [Azospirillum brasilense]|nr:MAG: hypothetical protein DI582_10155 [Azospirillum brasilense]
MFTPINLTFFLLLLPILTGAACLLALAQTAAAPARPHATLCSLMLAMLSAVGCLFLARDGQATQLNSSQLVLSALGMLAAQTCAATLIDRTRRAGLLFGSLMGAWLFVQFGIGSLPSLLPAMPRSGLLLVVLAAASFMGLIGSNALPMHPLRFTASMQPRTQALPQSWIFTGQVLLALCCAVLGWAMEAAIAPLAYVNIATSALVGAMASLWLAQRGRHPTPLIKAGEGLVAGVLVALLCNGAASTALACGVLASLCVTSAERMMHSLRIDDAPHLAGMVLLPAMLGLLVPGLLHGGVLAAQLQWLGASLGMGALAGILLWPLSMLLFGLQANARHVREGFSQVE